MILNNSRSLIYFFTLLFFSFIYFILFKNFYILDYEVPDFFAYSSWWSERNFNHSKDNFSTLFVFISQFSQFYYYEFKIASLLLISFSIFIFNLTSFFLNNLLSKILFIISNFSIGSFYYIYGKLYYEFPFISFFFSIIFLLSIYFLFLLKNDKIEKKVHFFILFLLAFLIGFLISWKSHSIFPLYGLGLLVLLSRTNLILNIFLYNFKNFLIFSFFIILGWSIGNFSIFYSIGDTYYGLKNVYQIKNIFFEFKKLYWHFFETVSMYNYDHVTTTSFTYGIYNFISLLILLFILPFFTKHKLKFMFVNISIFFFYSVFIMFFSTGYIWHGFSISLYIIVLIYYYLLEIDKNKNQKYIFSLIIVCVMTQVYFNYNYIKTSLNQIDITNIAVEKIEENSEKIILDIEKLITENNLNNKNFCIVSELKRKKILNNYNILEATHKSELNKIQMKSKSYMLNSKLQCANSKYIIGFKPKIIDQIIYYHPTYNNLINKIERNDYIVYFYLKEDSSIFPIWPK